MIDINRHKFFLVQILKDIYSDIELANALGFKGGTALMLQGLGELMDSDLKSFVRTKLRTETIGLLRFYKDFPILS